VNLVNESHCTCEIEQRAVPPAEVETNAVVQFSQIYGTEVKRPPIAFIQVIGSIHQAVKKDAMVDSKHVSGFMRHNLATSAQYERVPIRDVDSVKLRVIPGKAEHSNTIFQRSFTEDEVPRWCWIEIAHRNSHDAEPVCGQYLT
jgi:hypothetical protein